MDLVFSTDRYAQAQRYAAYRDALCDVYVRVEVKATDPEHYHGFIRETKFSQATLTDILVSEQTVERNRRHIARLDKDCHYLQLLQKGSVNVQAQIPSVAARRCTPGALNDEWVGGTHGSCFLNR